MKIDKNIPFPKPVKIGRPRKYDLDRLEVGDSFRVKTIYQVLYTSVKRYLKRPENAGKQFEIRRVGREKEFIRVHRVE